MFGARDIWFVVAIPIYFYAVLSDGSDAENRSAFFKIGTFMALWAVFYGIIQANAPKLLRAVERGQSALLRDVYVWSGALSVVPASLAILLLIDKPADMTTAVALVLGLLLFGGIFAVKSSLHSYLILAFSNADRVTMDVGFYYMSNAVGRLIGTLLSGFTYQVGGISLCLATSALMLVISAFGARQLSHGA